MLCSMEVGFIVANLISSTYITIISTLEMIANTAVANSMTVPLAISIPNAIITSTPVTTHNFHSNNATMQTHTVAAVQICEFQTLFEDVTWLKHHPHPLAVKTCDVHEAGASSRKLKAVREGMRALLIGSGVKRSLNCGDVSRPILRPVLTKIRGNGHFQIHKVNTSGVQKIGPHVDASRKKLDAVREGMRALMITSGVNRPSLSYVNITIPVLRPVLTNIFAKGAYSSPDGKIVIPPLISNTMPGSSVASTSLGVSTGLNKKSQ